MAGRKRSDRVARAVVITILIFGAIALLFMAVIVIHERENASNVSRYSEKPLGSSGYLEVSAKVESADLSKELLNVQLECVGRGDLLDNARKLKQDVTVSLLAEGMSIDRTLQAGKAGEYIEGELDLEGDVSDYPWDTHKCQLVVGATTGDGTGQSRAVPIRLRFQGALPGLNIVFHADAREADKPRVLDITVIRSTVTTTVVCFSIVLTWILIATVVAMVYAVAVQGHELQMMMFAFFGTLLFAMTAFRNSMPGTPPMGVLSDYLAFFWGYVVAIVALAVLTVTWMRRLPPRDEPEDGKES